jgi:hypothetical protein
MKKEFYLNTISDKVCAILFWTTILSVISIAAFCMLTTS